MGAHKRKGDIWGKEMKIKRDGFRYNICMIQVPATPKQRHRSEY
jgi:hypothetical protein